MTTNNAPVQGPQIDIPANPALAEEPALEIGKVFASKAMLQPIVAAALAIVARITGMVVDDELISDITTMVMFGAMIWAAVSAQVIASTRAKQQAAATRAAVWSPASVQEEIDKAVITGGRMQAEIDAALNVPPSDWATNQERDDTTP